MNDSDRSLATSDFSSRAEPEQADLRRAAPAVVLLAANLVPAVGVLLGGWSLLEVVALYWFENVVIGAINVLKMMTCAPDRKYLGSIISGEDGDRPRQPRTDRSTKGERLTSLGHHAMKAFFVPFFIFHYGMFCTVHGVFIFGLLGGNWPQAFGGGPLGELPEMITNILSGGTKFAALALIGSHLFSYVYHFLFRGEFRRTNVMQLMAAPYSRIVILHIAILFGAFAIQLLGQPMILLLLLVIGKTWLDWKMHVRVHDKLAEVTPT